MCLLAGALLLPASLMAKGYKIDGSVKNADGQKVIMYRGDLLSELQALDSAVVQDGKFLLKGQLAEPTQVTLRFFKDVSRGLTGEHGLVQRPCIPLFIGNDKVKVTAVLDSLPMDFEAMYYGTFNPDKYTATGSAINDEYRRYVSGYTAARKKLDDGSEAYYKYLQEQEGKVSPMVGVNEARKVLQLRRERADFQKGYILSHAADYNGLLALDRGMGLLSKGELQDVIGALSPKMKATAYGQRLVAKADTVMATARGSHFVDYDIEMADGSSKRLSDFLGKGNYTLLEFWASWCGPCRGSIPHLKQLYGLYHPQGFNILSVSIDMDKKAWKKAMDEEQMKWDLAVPKGDPRNICKIYNFNGIPYCILIDPKGNIVDTNTRDGFLDSYLTDIYGQKLDKVHISGQLTDVTDTLKVNYMSAEEGLEVRTPLVPIVVDKDGKFDTEYTVEKPGYIMIYVPVATQQKKGHKAIIGYSAPAIPGERLTINGTTEKPVYGGSSFYQDYGDMMTEFGKIRDAAADPEYDKLVAQFRKLSEAKPKGKKAQKANKTAMDALREKLQASMEKEINRTQEVVLAYVKAHPRQEVVATQLMSVPTDSLEIAIKGLNYFVQHGRMRPYIEAARLKAANEKTRSAAKEAIKEGAQAPDFTLKTPEGASLSLSDLRGKYVLLDFWGSWCHWCVKGIPDMKKAYAKHKDKVEFLSIDCNDSEAKWKEALAKYQMPWKHVKNEEVNGVPEKFAVQGYPTKILVDPTGKIAMIFEGEDPEFYTKLDEKLK